MGVLGLNTYLLGNVWHGSQEPWHNWDILAGRFVSEFGMCALYDFMGLLFPNGYAGRDIPTSAQLITG